jgi:hypothetical protein
MLPIFTLLVDDYDYDSDILQPTRLPHLRFSPRTPATHHEATDTEANPQSSTMEEVRTMTRIHHQVHQMGVITLRNRR